MAEDNSTYVFTDDVSETAQPSKPSTPVAKSMLRICDMATPMTKPSAKWQRKIKPLPDPIAEMTSADSHRLIISEELDPHSKSKTYGKSMRVVSRVKGIEPNDNDVILDHLTTDQFVYLQEILASQTWVPNTSLFVAWQWRHTSNFNINSLASVCLPLHVQTKQQQMFAGQSMSFLAINS